MNQVYEISAEDAKSESSYRFTDEISWYYILPYRLGWGSINTSSVKTLKCHIYQDNHLLDVSILTECQQWHLYNNINSHWVTLAKEYKDENIYFNCNAIEKHYLFKNPRPIRLEMVCSKRTYKKSSPNGSHSIIVVDIPRADIDKMINKRFKIYYPCKDFLSSMEAEIEFVE